MCHLWHAGFVTESYYIRSKRTCQTMRYMCGPHPLRTGTIRTRRQMSQKLWRLESCLSISYPCRLIWTSTPSYLTLWLCSDSCHSRCVPGQKWPDSKQLLINLSLCYIITKYWIHSFCQLVFFHLGLVLCFYLHLINRRPHLSESRLLIFEWKNHFYE